MNRELLERALKFYGVLPRKIFDEQKGYRNRSFRVKTIDGEDLNLIFFKSEEGILDRIKRADRLSEVAHLAGLPVRNLFDEKILVMENARHKIYARLYYYLPGETIAWETFTMSHIKTLGWAMSDLHFVWRNVLEELPLATDELMVQNECMSEYFGGKSIQVAMQEKLGVTIEIGEFRKAKRSLRATAKLKAQPLHLDLVRGNLLFLKNDNRSRETWRVGSILLSGVIDFEKAAAGHPILDLARSYAFLVVDVANKPPEKILKYLMESGYRKRGRNDTELDMRLFESLVQFFLVYDFYKFLKHNPYEALQKNHHFVRTRDILIRKNVIKLA